MVTAGRKRPLTDCLYCFCTLHNRFSLCHQCLGLLTLCVSLFKRSLATVEKLATCDHTCQLLRPGK
uniref:Uncharacterized protein n=1 Tax=Haplochromis burtoni TaxID=8153 RepID=A0A3Q2WT45_HAPBU